MCLTPEKKKYSYLHLSTVEESKENSMREIQDHPALEGEWKGCRRTCSQNGCHCLWLQCNGLKKHTHYEKLWWADPQRTPCFMGGYEWYILWSEWPEGLSEEKWSGNTLYLLPGPLPVQDTCSENTCDSYCSYTKQSSAPLMSIEV